MATELLPVIRPIRLEDNPQVCQMILSVLTEFGAVGEGYAYADPETREMFKYYQTPDSGYWVIEDGHTSRILGGGGFSRLKGTPPEENICELQKLYFYPETRGLGLGKKLMALILDRATKIGYDEMYLETIPPMTAAISLYQKFGFDFIPCHKGNTGHQKNCQVYMSRLLQQPAPLAG